MSEPLHTSEDLAPRRYGLLGLLVGLALIVAGAVLLCAIGAVLTIVGAIFVLGKPETLAAFQDLRDALRAGDAALIQRLGVIVSLVLYAAISFCVVAAAWLRGRRDWRALIGWYPWSLFRAGRTFWITVPVTIAYSIATDILISRFYPPSQDWIKLPPGALWTALFVLLAVVFAPVAEELVFRGWLYTGFRLKIGRWAANLLTSVLFALAHWEKTHLYALAVFPVGVALAYVRDRTDSLKASMTFHAMFNGVASILLVLNV